MRGVVFFSIFYGLPCARAVLYAECCVCVDDIFSRFVHHHRRYPHNVQLRTGKIFFFFILSFPLLNLFNPFNTQNSLDHDII